MAHIFEECMLSCQDPRLNELHYEILKKQKMLGQTDTIFFGNPILDLVNPESEEIKNFVLSKISIAVVNHQIKTIRLYNHFDCGYYKLRSYNFVNTSEEEGILKEHLRKAKEIILEKFKDNKINIYSYLIKNNNDFWFEEEI